MAWPHHNLLTPAPTPTHAHTHTHLLSPPPPGSRPDTIGDLVEANRAAHKSAVARRTGVEKTVSTAVPDPQRLVPSVAPRAAQQPAGAEASWACADCRHVNGGGRAECSRCHAPNAAHSRVVHSRDPLQCGEEEIARAACERHHPGLNKAFLEAGTPWVNVRRLG